MIKTLRQIEQIQSADKFNQDTSLQNSIVNSSIEGAFFNCDQSVDITLRRRIAELASTRLEFCDHPRFSDPQERERILSFSLPTLRLNPHNSSASLDDAFRFVSVYEVLRLSKEEETALFLKMNCLKFVTSKLIDALDPVKSSEGDLIEIAATLEEAVAIRDTLILGNLRLISAPVRTAAVPPNSTRSDLCSNACLSLIRAVDNFDVLMGYDFSTYATTSIKNSLNRPGSKLLAMTRSFSQLSDDEAWRARHEKDRRLTEGESIRIETAKEQVVRESFSILPENVRRVLEARLETGSDGKPYSLAEIAELLNIEQRKVAPLNAKGINLIREHFTRKGFFSMEDLE